MDISGLWGFKNGASTAALEQGLEAGAPRSVFLCSVQRVVYSSGGLG